MNKIVLSTFVYSSALLIFLFTFSVVLLVSHVEFSLTQMIIIVAILISMLYSIYVAWEFVVNLPKPSKNE